MSNSNPDLKSSLENQHSDYVVTAAKGILGAVPFAGSLLAEIAGTVIPNQRVDRLVKFAQELEKRFNQFDKELIRSKLTDEKFTDLTEECMRQAARSVSDERRGYIASLLSNGLSPDSVSLVESKHLLRILGELNDIEVLWLRFYLDPTIGGDSEYRQKHSSVFDVAPACIGCDQATFDKNALNLSYMQHLAELGLIRPRYEKDFKTRQPVFDSVTGGLKVQGYDITALGRLLLRQISLID